MPEKKPDLTHLIDMVDEKSRLLGGLAGVAKGIISKDPDALDGSFVEYILKNQFGDAMYDKIRRAYRDMIGV